MTVRENSRKGSMPSTLGCHNPTPAGPSLVKVRFFGIPLFSIGFIVLTYMFLRLRMSDPLRVHFLPKGSNSNPYKASTTHNTKSSGGPLGRPSLAMGIPVWYGKQFFHNGEFSIEAAWLWLATGLPAKMQEEWCPKFCLLLTPPNGLGIFHWSGSPTPPFPSYQRAPSPRPENGAPFFGFSFPRGRPRSLRPSGSAARHGLRPRDERAGWRVSGPGQRIPPVATFCVGRDPLGKCFFS